MILKPINDNIVIKINKQVNEKTKAGIIIPKIISDNIKSDKGEVVAVGSGRTLNTGEKIIPEVAVGDLILFNRFSGTEIIDKEDTYLIIKENDIMAIIK